MKLVLKITLIVFAFLLTKNGYSQVDSSRVDEFSNVPCYVETFNKNNFLGNATGFFFRTKTKLYFITNDHVVGGEYYKNDYLLKNKHSVPLDSIPNRLEIRVHGNTLNKTSIINVSLESNNKPTYLSFSKNKEFSSGIMDIAVIPIENYTDINSPDVKIIYLVPANQNRDLILIPSTELFIVGFPFDYGKVSNYPIWKKGTIASEPNLLDPNFYIDATTRAGMSGSPVVFRGTSYQSKLGQNFGGLSTFLVGIYSAQNYMTELGVVWKLEKVIEYLNQIDK